MSKKYVNLTALQSDKEIRATENQHCKDKIGYPRSDPDNAVELT
jgi:hypothetical protein